MAIGKKVKKKICSRAGATITFALLLFLVCAVLCSVALAAATAAAGRMSGIAALDQKYYSVTSAAGLVRDLVAGEEAAPVSIVKVTTSQSTASYRDGTKTGTSATEGPTDKTYLVGKAAGDIVEEEDLVDANLLSDSSSLASGSLTADAARQYYRQLADPSPDPADAAASKTLALTSDLVGKGGFTSLSSDPLAVTIAEKVLENGDIEMTISNTEGDPFRQRLLFTASIDKSTSTRTQEGTPQDITETAGDGGETHTSYTVTATTRKIETWTFRWTLGSIKTLSAAPGT